MGVMRNQIRQQMGDKTLKNIDEQNFTGNLLKYFDLYFVYITIEALTGGGGPPIACLNFKITRVGV